jgi:hypothetical protein
LKSTAHCPRQRHHDNGRAGFGNRGERVSHVIIGAHREEGFADESPALPAQQLPQRLSRDARPDIIVADEVEPFREFLFAKPMQSRRQQLRICAADRNRRGTAGDPIALKNSA